METSQTTALLDKACNNAGEVCYSFSCPVRAEQPQDYSTLSAGRLKVFQRGALFTILALTYALPKSMTVGELQAYIENRVDINKS
jgi:hypothetical protein